MGSPPNVRDAAYYQVMWRINRLILHQLEFGRLTQEIVNAIFEELNAGQMGYALIALLLVDEAKRELHRVAISQTDYARLILEKIPDYFEKVVNPLSDDKNLAVRAYKIRSSVMCHDWGELLAPYVDPKVAQDLQRMVGVKTIIVQPILYAGKCLGVMNFNLTRGEETLGEHEKMLLAGIAEAAGVALENSSMYSKLQELDKLKDEFLSVAAHELRTPMTAIKGYAYQLLKDPQAKYQDPKSREYLERVYKSTDRLVTMVNDMLDVSRIESGGMEFKTESFDMGQLITEVIGELRPKIDEKRLGVNAAVGQLPVKADRTKTGQVVMNLLGNAVKFTPEGGKIEISGQMGQVLVKDSGVGIGREDLSRLFGKFSRVKSGEGVIGTGLGLYICKQLVEKMGGKIWANSAGAGQGATFGFSLPTA